MDDSTLFTTTFAAQIRALDPALDDMTEAKASLSDLKSLMPSDINPEDDPALLYIVANLAVAGLVNLNDDGLDIPTALAVYKKFEKQQVNIEHNRHRCVGFILKAGLSELGTDRIITEEEARAANKPFNITTLAVLWRVVDRDLCDYIVEASNPLHPDFKSLSLSFEMGFKDFTVVSLANNEKDIAKASKIVTSESQDFDKYKTYLRAYKGTGLSPDNPNERIYRIMPESVIPLGQGIVSIPAAAVKGIMAVTQPLTPVTTTETIDDSKAKETAIQVTRDQLISFLDSLNKKSPTYIISNKTRVFQNIEKAINYSNMNKADLQTLKDQVAKAQKPEEFQTVFASLSDITDKLAQESERMVRELEEQKNASKVIEQNKVELQAALDRTTAEFASLKQELQAMKLQQAAAAAEQTFNDRMGALDGIFDLDDETRAFFAEEVKACATDEAFAAKVDKFKKLMKEKTKSFKADEAKKKKEKADEMCAALATKGIKVVVDAESLDFKEIIASAAENVTSAPVHNSVETRTSLADQARAAFAGMTIGGKKMEDFAKKQ